MRNVTIKDIARQLNVSTTTVSNALNDKPGVGKHVKKKIIKTAGEMGYHPNYFAKGLVSRKSHSIGLTISNISDPFSAELARGAFDRADELGYTVMLFNTGYDLTSETRAIEIMQANGIDGILLSTVLKNDPNIDLLDKIKTPYVLVNRLILNPKKTSRIDSVSMDTYGGFYDATRHICRLGHTDIAMIAGDMKASTGITLTNGAMDALTDYGLTIKPEKFIKCGFSRTRAYRAAKKLLCSGKRPTAILIQGDNMALGVREAAFETGIKIPEDLAIVGYDDISIASLAGIELTTVWHDTYQMGANGVQLLVDKIKSEDHKGVSSKMVMESKLVIRKTCGYHSGGYIKD